MVGTTGAEAFGGLGLGRSVTPSFPATHSWDRTGKRIGYPRIGAGLAKGDWGVISNIIDVELGGEDHTLVEYAAQ